MDVPQRFGELLIELGLVTENQVHDALALQPMTGTRLGEALVSMGHLTRTQLQRALAHALKRGDSVVLDRPPLGEVLLGLGHVTAAQLDSALDRQRRDGRRLGELLVDAGACGLNAVYEGLSLQARMSTGADALKIARDIVPGSAAKRRILVVDDSALALALLDQGLTAHGFDVTCVQDPFIGLQQVEQLRPHLVVVDWEMPGIDGIEVARRLKASASLNIPVIILTGSDDAAPRVKGLNAGADDFVSKGASVDELAARIETVLRRTNETDRVRNLFARYTSDAVVNELLRQGGNIALTGERREVTVLFADVRGFTALAESMPPEETLSLLNDVLGRLADAVLAWGGTLDKFLGDGLMAVWGAPVKHDHDVESALSAALAMIDAVNQRQRETPESHVIQLGIGLNTGIAIVGSVGNARRSEYTCIGDVVNVASRLCGMAGPQEILMGEVTGQQLVTLAPPEKLQPVRVKGKSQPVELFRCTPALEQALRRQRRL